MAFDVERSHGPELLRYGEERFYSEQKNSLCNSTANKHAYICLRSCKRSLLRAGEKAAIDVSQPPAANKSRDIAKERSQQQLRRSLGSQRGDCDISGRRRDSWSRSTGAMSRSTRASLSAAASVTDL